jgi:phosphatidylinositol-3-phosphatase
VAVLALPAVALAAALAPAATQPKPARYVGVATKAAGSTKALDVARPGGVGAGDLLLAAIELRAPGRRVSAPEGWRPIRRDRARRGHSSLAQALYSKVAGPQEPSHYQWRFSSAAPALGAIVAYRGVDAGSPIASSSGHTSRNVHTIRASSLRQTPAGTLLVGFFGHTGARATRPPAGLRERLDHRGGSRHRPVRLEVVDSSRAGASVRGAKSATVRGRQGLAIGQLVALRPGTTTPPPHGPCRGAKAPGRYDHVVWIVFENHSYKQIIGSSSAPYFNQLAGKCGLATNATAIRHPSLPNYIGLTSGSTQGITDDGSPSKHPLNVPSIFSQLRSGGSRSLQESMPSNCALGSSGRYAVKHNPEAYYTNVRGDCTNYDVPRTSPANISARFTFVTPNLCSDMHDCSVSTGDSWLAGFLPHLLASSQYRAGKTVIFVTFDEGSSDNHIVTIVVAPPVRPGARSGTAYTHYSLLRTTEEMLGLGLLGNAGSATSMRAGFGL